MKRVEMKTTVAATPHYLYDLSLPLPERKYQRMEFPSGIAVAAFLGVAPQRIYVSRANKHRIWSEAQGRWFCVRIANSQTITTNE